MGFLKTIMLVLFLLTCVYRLFYMVLRLLRKKRPVNGETLGRYAVMISARNEEKVIGLLLTARMRRRRSHANTAHLSPNALTPSTSERAMP